MENPQTRNITERVKVKMQNCESQEFKAITATQMYSMDLLNGNHLGNQPAFPGQAYGAGNKNNITLEQVDPSTFGDDDSDDDDFSRGIKPGKKTKGRVKIKMEFIENKLRRYTTFSKRKTGIMKKAYELSTLTGTQVMLLVASETGHVYTFATRKLQPMITSESGKSLIQTCLNSPDPPPMAPGQQQAVEQRMNPGGFEETELTYAVDEDGAKIVPLEISNGSYKPTYSLSNSSSSESLVVPTQQPTHLQQGQTYQLSSTPQSSSVSMATVVHQQQPMSVVNSSQSTNSSKTGATSGISMQLPVTYPGFIIQPGNTFTIPVQNNQGTQLSTSQTQQVQQQAVYRIPTQSGTHQLISSSQLIQSDTGQRPQSSINTTGHTTVLSAAGQQATPALTPSVYMYQTPQGIVYAPATGSMQDKPIFNFQQPATALSVSQDPGGQQQSQGQQHHQQQIITIPVPVSLAGSQQILQLATDGQTELSQPSAAKKSRK